MRKHAPLDIYFIDSSTKTRKKRQRFGRCPGREDIKFQIFVPLCVVVIVQFPASQTAKWLRTKAIGRHFIFIGIITIFDIFSFLARCALQYSFSGVRSTSFYHRDESLIEHRLFSAFMRLRKMKNERL